LQPLSSKRTIKRIFIALLALLGYQVVEALFMLPVSGHWRHATFSSIILLIVGFTTLILWLGHVYRRFTSDVEPADHHGLRFTREQLRRALKGLLVGFVILATVQLVSSLLISSGAVTQSNNENALNTLLSQAHLPMTLFITIAAPITEEFIFRGLFMNVAGPQRTRGAQAINIILSAGCFTIVHGPTNLIDVALYGGMGLGLAFTYALSRDLKCSMALHLLNNIIATFIG
jgi:membrane protease YdiL (CAAX protease family)